MGDTADYTWALFVISCMIVVRACFTQALNYPLRSLILFHALLNALTVRWHD